MKLRRVINGLKTIKDWGTWKVGVKMPKTAFPVSRSGFKVPSPYTWRVVRFECEGDTYRLLMFYRLDLQRCAYYLGREVGADLLVLCRYEFHPGEPGWHMHCVCDDKNQQVGRLGSDEKRLPHWESFHREMTLGIASNDDAHKRAVRVFRLDKEPPFDLQG